MTLGEYIKAYRDEHDLSQRAFAQMTGLSNVYISFLEKGSNPSSKSEQIIPSISTVQAIANATGRTIDELLNTLDDMDIDISTPNKNIEKFRRMIPILSDQEKIQLAKEMLDSLNK